MIDLKSINNIDDLIRFVNSTGQFCQYIDVCSEQLKMELIKRSSYYIWHIINPSTEIQTEVVKGFKYYDDGDDITMRRNIRSVKARKLYYKLKKVRGVIK
jgi:hypothetical protein